jgi:hypothetical protein
MGDEWHPEESVDTTRPRPTRRRSVRFCLACPRWATRKFKRLKDKWVRAWAWLSAIIQREPRLFAHWGLF